MEEVRVVKRDEVSIPKSFDQLGILILDGSGSMHGTGSGNLTKAENVNMAIKDLISRFQASINKANFSFAIITFSDKNSVNNPPITVSQPNRSLPYVFKTSNELIHRTQES